LIPFWFSEAEKNISSSAKKPGAELAWQSGYRNSGHANQNQMEQEKATTFFNAQVSFVCVCVNNRSGLQASFSFLWKWRDRGMDGGEESAR